MAKKKKKSMKEQPFKPEVDTGIEKPVRGMLAVGDVNDKYSTYPSNGLTPRRLARIFRAADGGDVFEQMELFEEMEEKDTHLFSQLQTRKLAVTGLDWEVQPFSDDERDKEIAEFINEQLKGIENLDEIIAEADGIMVARGDMGVEIDFAEIPAIQKHLIDRAMSAGKICITATQMLDSMIVNPRPTRAEITDVANAIYDGTGAVMLSGETAAGKYPVEALKAMATIAETTEADSSFDSLVHHSGTDNSRLNISAAVGHAACTTATDIGASAIITASKSGETARLLSRFRPDTQIIACVLDETTRCQLNVYRGVTPLLMDYATSTDELISMSVAKAKSAGLVQDGDLVVVTAGVPVGISGTTNMIKVHMVGDSLLAGVGIGNHNAKGEVCVCRNATEAAKKFKPGQILVVPFTTNDTLPFMREAAGIITEEAGTNSHSAIVGLTLDKAVIVGATNATRTLKDGMTISMDCARGVVQAMAK